MGARRPHEWRGKRRRRRWCWWRCTWWRRCSSAVEAGGDGAFGPAHRRAQRARAVAHHGAGGDEGAVPRVHELLEPIVDGQAERRGDLRGGGGGGRIRRSMGGAAGGTEARAGRRRVSSRGRLVALSGAADERAMLASTPRRHSPVTPSAATSCCSASLAVRLRACPDTRGAVRGCSGRQVPRVSGRTLLHAKGRAVCASSAGRVDCTGRPRARQ